MWWGKIALIGAGVIVLGFAGMFLLGPRPTSTDTDAAGLPQFIQADFIELDRIASISKFRSGSGHDFSSGDESCRSMKHYFNPPPSQADQAYRDTHEGLPPPPDGANDIVISSPVDGTVLNVEEEGSQFGRQIYIRPSEADEFTIRLFHIYPDEGLKKGSKVTAGQRIGVIGGGQTTDVAIMHGGFLGPQFVSYFSVISDSVFAAYQARGITSRDDLIVTKEYRDAHPYQCNGEQFAEQYQSDPDYTDEVYLSGFSRKAFGQTSH